MVDKAKRKICLVPVTRPYLFFLPDPKLFFTFEYEKNWSDFSLNIQENFKERFKSVHVNILNIKQNLIILV